MPMNYVRENVPLSRFGVLVAQLESIVASASHKLPDPLLCFDLLSDLISAIHEEPKESVLLWQRKCEDALFSLLILGARRPVRHLASAAMGKIIYKGDNISIYSRVSSLQGFLSDGKKSEPLRIAGAAQCLGELYRLFGKKITSGLLGTTSIVAKLMKFSEDFVRREALQMLRNALEGSGGNGSIPAYAEAFRIIMKLGVVDKSFIVRKAAARCLKAFANIGGPGLGAGELDNSASLCVKALEDPESSVRDAFAEALGALLALATNPQAQVQPKGKGQSNPKKPEGSLQKHLISPFTKASGPRSKNLRIGLTLSWVFFLQAMHLKYMHPDSELQNFLVQIMDMLRADSSVDAQSLACVYYILRVGVIDQMTEPTQRVFLVNLGKQLQSPDASPSMKIAALRTLSYALKTLGEVPLEFKEVLDDTAVAALSNSSPLVRAESALTLRSLAEIDPTCVGGLVNYGVTTLKALRENVSFEKGNNLMLELDSLSGQATVLAALASVSPKLPLGYPARLPRTMLDVARKMLTETSRNPVVATVEKEAGWLLLSSLLSSMPKEEMEDQVFDILSLWTDVFSRVQDQVNSTEDLSSKIRVWSAAVDALIAFIRCFVSQDAVNKGILLQPVLLYLNRALSYISSLSTKDSDVKASMDILISRTLIAYQSLYDPMTYKSDHPQLIQICTSPFREASKYEESSYLRILLDSRDAWLGPWVPGRDWFEDELRAFQGGKDGDLPCVWETEIPSFPQPETISKMLVNQMLLCFGIMFATQDSSGMLSLLSTLEQCLKSGKKHALHATSVTNVCVGLLSGLKATLTLRSQPLEMEILNAVQGIFQSILAEGGICESQRRASSEGLGLLARLGNDMFTARLTRSLLGDLTGATDSHYAGSIALALGCIHRSAGGMALSSLVPSTVNSISSLAKSSNASLQVWALHGLLLTIEAAGLSYVSQVQATLGLAMEILLSEENGWVVLQQGVCRLINAIVAVLGPELHPGSIFFSRCKSVIAEISSQQETATLLESVRFSQQLVLFAPQAVTVHSHVKVLLSTLSSRQPTLRHLAVSTLRHLIEKDPEPIIEELIEENLFHMLDEETDTEIGKLVKTTIMRLLYASCPSFPSRWLSICRNLVLATSSGITRTNKELDDDPVSGPGGDTSYGEDDENMVSSSQGLSGANSARDKHLRYRTRVFAAECLSHVPDAVGQNPAHFDLSLARSQSTNLLASRDWLVLQVQELISLAYQISTIQFENMRPIGVGLLSTILDKFGKVPDPELPGHLLLEQNQAQLVSAVRTALDTSSGPVLLEAGLLLASKILTSGMISGDQLAVKRIFALISQPLEDFKDLYYPSFAEWVSCKIKIRLLTAHASLKCYTYAFLRRHQSIPEEYLGLLPLFSKNSSTLGIYWLSLLKDYSYVCLRTRPHIHWTPFLDGIQSSLVAKKLKQCLEESWPFILQAVSLDAVPMDGYVSESSRTSENTSKSAFFSGYSMVELKQQDYQFLWSFSLLVLFQGQHATPDKTIIPLDNLKSSFGSDSPVADKHSIAMKFYEMILPVFGFLSAEKFFGAGFLTIDLCRELLQVFSYYIFLEDILDSHAISVLSQIVKNCPKNFFETGEFAYQAAELCLSFMFKFLQSAHVNASSHTNWEDKISLSFTSAKNLLMRLEPKKQLQLALAFLLVGYKCVGEASNDVWLLNPVDYVQSVVVMLKNLVDGKSKLDDDAICYLRTITRTCLNMNINMTNDCIKNIHQLEDKMTNSSKLPQKKLAFSLEQIITFAKLAYEIELISDNQESKPIFYSMLCQCRNSFHEVLKDQHIQVQATALQTLTGVTRDSNAESSTFITFFIGELLNDIFWIIKQALKKPVKREAITVAGDCLKILMLLHTSSKVAESQTSLMSLLLEAIVMVLLASENDSSQEVKELKTASVRLVSQLAQSQTSAGYFKDALLSMPSTRRQKLQEIIRASVTQDQISTPTKSQLPPLVIKMPSQPEETKRQISPPLAATIVSDVSNDDNEEDEEEDDWDTFQSFPASTSEPKSTENVSSDKNVLQENTTSLTKSSSTSTSTTSSEDEDEGEKENNISGDGDEEEEEVTNENILDQLSKVLTDMAEESSKSSSTSESDSDEKGSTHSNVASEKDEHDKDDSQSGNDEKASTHSSADDDFSGQHSTSQYVDEEKNSTHSNGASEKDELEQVEDFVGQPSTSPSANEEKKPTQSSADEDVPGQHSTSEFVNGEKDSTHSNAASEKDEREKDEDFLSQNSASQSVNEEKRSTHSSADEDFSGQDSTSQFVSDEIESTHSNVVSQKDEREKEEDLSGLHTSSPSVDEEKGSTHSNATLEKDEPEQVGDFFDQRSTSQSVNVEKEATHSNAALGQDDDFSGQDSTQFLNEEESTHSNVSPEKDEQLEEEDFSGQHTTSHPVNEEEGDNASVKDEPEHDASFSDQHYFSIWE
ncbi:HEAT repeat-containing protein [Artemisia annua]|uniref:HEAT repeat-containing protein n=1 Tax=Artemisia annua TaxID=35608 RepID=A0A2U1PPB7_ARTAN|nr:HEAT repeat-containing protein [Artemisia annua]